MSPRNPTCRTLVVLCGLLHAVACALAQSPPAPTPSADDFKRLAEVFGPSISPDIKDRQWVTIDRGPSNWPDSLDAWLIRDEPGEMLVLNWLGETHKLRKPTPQEKRPAIPKSAEGRFDWDTFMNADRSVAWSTRTEDFLATSQKFLVDPPPDDSLGDNAISSANKRFEFADYIVNSARHAHLARVLGQTDIAAGHYARALNSLKKYSGSYLHLQKPPPELPHFVVNRMASVSVLGALRSAHGDAPRKQLKQRWEEIAALPLHQFRDVAQAMVKHYQNLIEEDTRWVEPDVNHLAKLTTAQKVTYWLYHLRDLAVGQWIDPGDCNILDQFAFNNSYIQKEKKPPNPAVELQKLGMAAVPQLIAHLDDLRPTRCLGHWRSYWPESQYLLRYADCCQQIFESITKHKIFTSTSTVSYPVHDGVEKQCKEAADKWWKEYLAKKTDPK
jgi:hypothetical protein